MSEQEDKDSKTEEPTEKKIRDAIDKGNIPASKEASVLASFLGVLLIGSFVTVTGVQRLTAGLTGLIDNAGGYSLGNGSDAILLTHSVGLQVGRFLAPVVAILMVAGLAASFLQNAPRFVLNRIQPQFSRLSLVKGWERLFGAQGLVEFGKALFKFGTISLVSILLLRSNTDGLVNAMFTDPSALPETILHLSMKLLSGICIATILLVALDLVWARMHWRQKLKMSRQELKDEYKQSEGDPLVKARQRSIARDRARNRMMSSVPQATLVIANPTHFAVALRYDRDETAAPVVIAKGQDLIALKIRQIAEDNNIPVIENRELARALYASTELERMIPPQFYRMVAEIISYVYSRKTVKVV